MKTPEEHGIKLKKWDYGTQKGKCPVCQPPHKMSDNPLSVTINEEGTVWFCHHCDWRGSYFNRNTKNFVVRRKDYKRPTPPADDVTSQLYKYFEKRGIRKQIVDKFKIKDEKGWFAFQYFNKDGDLENIKYRTADKKFRQTQGAKQILYNYDVVHDKDTLVFVEGEMDV